MGPTIRPIHSQIRYLEREKMVNDFQRNYASKNLAHDKKSLQSSALQRKKKPSFKLK